MGKISNMLLATAIAALVPLSALASRPAPQLVTIPISVYLTPDARSIHSQAVACAARAHVTASNEEQTCRNDGRVLYTSLYTSRNNRDITVTVSTI